ncbi:MAG TPA: hypothetical protein VK905_02910 [Bacillota bacterium]|nr:hypothetical protein [Bacillota bacterium]
MRPGNQLVYILLTNTGTLFTRALGLCTGAPYNHSSLAFDSDLSEVYSFGRLKPRNPFIGGFIREDRRKGLYALKQETTCAVFELNVSDEELALLRQAVTEFDAEREKYKYSLLGLVGVAVHRPINRPYAFFCSQFVTTALERAGVYLFDKPAGLVTPEDFQKHPDLKLMYEAKLKEYRAEPAHP